ncbi:hypothetical protein QE250_16775, partial [Chromatiaceae bacterium AAb-1]|nr:hypothetical protein [Chromatiaceae bacterium AAb-1]
LSIKGYDVVQLVNPFIFPARGFPRQLVINQLKKNNKKLFLLAAGSDAFYWRFADRKLRYTPHADYLKYDKNSSSHVLQSEMNYRFNRFVVSKCDGVIPIMYDYAVCYDSVPNLRDVIPIPMNTDTVRYCESEISDKLLVFHGLNRYGFKGTRFVEQSYKILEQKYPGKLELIIKGNMPLAQYLELMARTSIVIDQTNSYSLGVNGVYALAMGKVVLGGAEPESVMALQGGESPVLNVLPDANSIVQQVEKFIDNPQLLRDTGIRSREYAISVHDYIRVAKQYIKTWQS